LGKRFRAQCAGIIFLTVCIIPIEVFSEALEVKYEFERPQVETVKIDNMLFDRVAMHGAPNSGKIGHPALPCYGAYILLPYGSEIAEIEINTSEKILVGEGYVIEPVEKPFILSSSDNLPPIYKDPSVYSLKTAIPVNRFDKIDIQYFHGYQMLILKLAPMEYIPATGILSYYRDMTVRVTTTTSDKSSPVLRNLTSDEIEVAARIDNPDDIATYQTAARVGGKGPSCH
jgi:hypothetical protein